MRFLAFLFLVGVSALGWVVVKMRIDQAEEHSRRLAGFAAKFREFCGRYSEERDTELYDWLNRRVMAVQRELNELVSASPYRDLLREDPARARVLIEALEQMGQTLLPEPRITAIQTYLTRCQGVMDEALQSLRKRARNPSILFREGMRALVLCPVLVERWAKGQAGSRLQEPDSHRVGVWVTRATLVGSALPGLILLLGWAPFASGWKWLLALAGDLAETARTLVAEAFPE